MGTQPTEDKPWPPPSAQWIIKLLGGLEVTSSSGKPVRFRSRTALALLAFLSLNKPKEFAREQLQELFWPESDGDRQAQNLRRAVADLRNVLEEGTPRGHVVATRRNYVSLNTDRIATDVERFLDLTSSTDGDDECLSQAAALYTGPLLAHLTDPWISGPRMNLEERFAQAIDRLCGSLIEKGELNEAIRAARTAAIASPGREDVHIALIRAYGAAGMSVEALRQFEEFERVLDDTWGEAPSERARIALDAAFANSPPKHNLPVPTTSFVGRDKEIEEVCDLIKATRLVTLTGSGGCGKTRLALEAARKSLDDYRDGVWLVELAPLADPDHVPRAVATVLGVIEQSDRPIEETLLSHLRSKQILLILDNCEHLLTNSAKLSEEVLRRCPDVKMMASSREGLRIAGEATYRVPSLSLPNPKLSHSVDALYKYESVQLFVERARQVQSTFAITSHNAEAVVSVCTRLDGIPLAIELAVARLRTLSVEEVNQRIDQRFRLLTGGSRTALPRQQTLRSLIDWSYDLLNAAEKCLLSRLAVFSGGWTLESAEHVCVGSPVEPVAMLDLLTSLYDKNLVTADQEGGATRFGMLETVRQYARDRLLESGEGEGVRCLHLAHFLDLAEEADKHLIGHDRHAWFHRLDREQDNFRGALDWSAASDRNSGLRLACGMSRFWFLRGHLSEGRNWFHNLLPPGSDATADAAKALVASGWMALYQSDYPAAKSQFEQSLRISRALGDQAGVAASLNCLGATASEQGDYTTARPFYEESLTAHREVGNRRGIGGVLSNLGSLAYVSGDYATAEALYEEALDILRESNSEPSAAHTMYFQALLASARGDHASAHALYIACLATFRKLEYRYYVAISLEGLARHSALCASTENAARIWGARERLLEEMGCELPGLERSLHEQHLATARAAFADDEAFDRAWQEGRAMTMDEAIELAHGKQHVSP